MWDGWFVVNEYDEMCKEGLFYVHGTLADVMKTLVPLTVVIENGKKCCTVDSCKEIIVDSCKKGNC